MKHEPFPDSPRDDAPPDVLVVLPGASGERGVPLTFSAYTGLAPAQLRGSVWLDAVHPEDRPRVEAAWREAVRLGCAFEAEYRLRTAAGDYRWVFTRSGLTADIHQYKLLEDKLARTEAEFQRFAYAASHDLREPLRMIASYSQLLLRRMEGHLDEETGRYASFLEQNTARLQRMIAGLLEYSRAGQPVAWPKALIDANLAIDLALARLHPLPSTVAASITRDALPRVAINETLLMQVFEHLIGNALKFRSAQPPRVHISARRDGAAWLFEVRDNGIGFDPKYAERIFGLFQRLHSHTEIEGSGLGLAVARRIVEQQGGRIWAESAAGRGARFSFTIPDDEECAAG